LDPVEEELVGVVLDAVDELEPVGDAEEDDPVVVDEEAVEEAVEEGVEEAVEEAVDDPVDEPAAEADEAAPPINWN